jgi:hypothetical protein
MLEAGVTETVAMLTPSDAPPVLCLTEAEVQPARTQRHRRREGFRRFIGARASIKAPRQPLVSASKPHGYVSSKRRVVVGWEGFDAVKAVQEAREEHLDRLEAPFRK